MNDDITLEDMQLTEEDIELELGNFPFIKGQPGNGILKIEKTDSKGLVDIYTITYDNGTTTTYQITNGKNGTNGENGQTGEAGNGIVNIEKTNTIGLIDTYTITYTNGTIATFEIKNGKDGQEIDFIVVTELPIVGKTNSIYLKLNEKQQQNNIYDEYIYTQNSWEKIGTTDIDLSNYYTIEQIQKLLKEKADIENGVIVSSTEPQTKEKVWLQKGKNLFNKNTGIIKGYFINADGSIQYGTELFYTENYIPANSNNAYTISSKYSAIYRIAEYDKDYNFIKRQFNQGASTKHTINTAGNTKYLRISCDINAIDSIQLEEGSQATPYEPYIEKKILTKNSNGVFEEFYNEENIKTETITNENGTAIKYANGLMKIYRKIENVTIDITTAWGSLFIGKNDTIWKFPLAFISEPFDYSIKMEADFNASVFPVNYLTTKVTNDSIKNVSLGRPTSRAGVVGTIYITATGYWK